MWTGGQILTALARFEPYECVKRAQLVKLVPGLSPAFLAEQCEKLIAGGLLRKTDRGCHQLTAAGRAAAKGEKVEARRRGRSALRGNVWHALRNSDKHALSIPDLVERVAQGGERDIEHQIGSYLVALARGGYLMQMPLRERSLSGSRGHARWRLIKDTGPQAPVHRRPHGRARITAGSIYDPNTREETKLSAAYPRAVARGRQRVAA